MHRHVGLQPLSREHHVALVIARRLRLAAATDEVERHRQAAREALADWDVAVAHHFDDEERLLVPLIAEDALRRRLLADHAALRAWIAELRAAIEAPAKELLARGAQRLAEHVRWEERTLFPAIEASASEARLTGLATETAAADARLRATRRG